MQYLDYIKSKKLYNKTTKLIKEFEKVITCNWLVDMQFEDQHQQIQRIFYESRWVLKTFRDNIDNNDAF